MTNLNSTPLIFDLAEINKENPQAAIDAKTTLDASIQEHQEKIEVLIEQSIADEGVPTETDFDGETDTDINLTPEPAPTPTDETNPPTDDSVVPDDSEVTPETGVTDPVTPVPAEPVDNGAPKAQ